MTIRVLLADDQALVRTSFRMLIESEPDMSVVGEAATGEEAVELARSTLADVVLMDIRMPDMDGLAATRAISADEDLAGVRVLILTTFEADEHVFRALRAGASGFLGKSVELSYLLDAIRLVALGEALLSPRATRALIAHYLTTPDRTNAPAPELTTLTDRERQVLDFVAMRPLQRGHRRAAPHLALDRQDTREPHHGQAPRPRPRPTRRDRLPDRPR